MTRKSMRVRLCRPWLRENGALLWRRIALLAIALAVLFSLYWPVRAAIELMYFTAESTDTAVLLRWATVREIDVEGFLILCKRLGEPDSAYHWIGQRAATGGPDQGAEYSFDVTEGVYFGEQYCFRLEEVTTNDEPGEIRDICGYGPGVTPTPATDATALSVLGSITPIVVTPIPGQSPAPTLVTPGPTPTWTPIGQSPLDANQGPTVTPTSTQFGSPLGVTTLDANAAGLSDTPTPTFVPTETATATPTIMPTSTATQPPSPLGAQADAFGSVAPGNGPPSPVEPPQPEAAAIQPTPTALYIVVTATPTAQALAVAPTLTPLPTATVAPDLGLFNVLEPSAQSMMVMMLCLIFLSATGLGTLGLVTAVLYFRSQSQQRTDGRGYLDQRRF
ncbi:MAG: hypothetical protein ACK2UO_01110 [Caldilineaceae bacterium]